MKKFLRYSTVKMNKTSTQIPLYLPTKNQYKLQDFISSSCNSLALQAVTSWPNWSFFALSIFGPTGSGKTHLAHIFADYVNLKMKRPISISLIKACDLKINKIDYLCQHNPCLIIEDITTHINEEALFHLFNSYQSKQGYLLFTSEIPLARLNFKLKDLSSRLKQVPSVAISEPDDQMLEALIVKLFSDRQILISGDILNYIIQNMERSFAYGVKLVSKIDEISLIKKRSVSITIVKEAMHLLNQNVQQDLF